MRVDRFIGILNDISDTYIVEYADVKKNKRRKKNLSKWGILAACLAICVLLFVPSISHFFNKAQMEDSRGGFTHEFSSYEKLCEILPENSILRKIPTEDYIVTKCEGTCLYYSDQDVSKYENYSYLYITVYCKETEKSIQIKFVPKYHETAEYYRTTRMKFCPEEYYDFTTIGDTDIYLSKTRNVNDVLVSCANWAVDTDIYEVRSGFENDEQLIEFIESLLK